MYHTYLGCTKRPALSSGNTVAKKAKASHSGTSVISAYTKPITTVSQDFTSNKSFTSHSITGSQTSMFIAPASKPIFGSCEQPVYSLNDLNQECGNHTLDISNDSIFILHNNMENISEKMLNEFNCLKPYYVGASQHRHPYQYSTKQCDASVSYLAALSNSVTCHYSSPDSQLWERMYQRHLRRTIDLVGELHALGPKDSDIITRAKISLQGSGKCRAKILSMKYTFDVAQSKGQFERDQAYYHLYKKPVNLFVEAPKQKFSRDFSSSFETAIGFPHYLPHGVKCTHPQCTHSFEGISKHPIIFHLGLPILDASLTNGVPLHNLLSLLQQFQSGDSYNLSIGGKELLSVLEHMMPTLDKCIMGQNSSGDTNMYLFSYPTTVSSNFPDARILGYIGGRALNCLFEHARIIQRNGSLDGVFYTEEVFSTSKIMSVEQLTYVETQRYVNYIDRKLITYKPAHGIYECDKISTDSLPQKPHITHIHNYYLPKNYFKGADIANNAIKTLFDLSNNIIRRTLHNMLLIDDPAQKALYEEALANVQNILSISQKNSIKNKHIRKLAKARGSMVWSSNNIYRQQLYEITGSRIATAICGAHSDIVLRNQSPYSFSIGASTHFLREFNKGVGINIAEAVPLPKGLESTTPFQECKHLQTVIYHLGMPTLDRKLTRGDHLIHIQTILNDFDRHPRYGLTDGSYEMLATLNNILPSMDYCIMGQGADTYVSMFVVSKPTASDVPVRHITRFSQLSLNFIFAIEKIVQRLPDYNGELWKAKDICGSNDIDFAEKMLYTGPRLGLNYIYAEIVSLNARKKPQAL